MSLGRPKPGHGDVAFLRPRVLMIVIAVPTCILHDDGLIGGLFAVKRKFLWLYRAIHDPLEVGHDSIASLELKVAVTQVIVPMAGANKVRKAVMLAPGVWENAYSGGRRGM